MKGGAVTDSQSTMPARLLKPSEAALFLAVSERTIKRLTARGELPHVRVGRSMRFVMEDLLAYVAGNRRLSGG
jgi:excisionase family DNA binding protein